MDNVFIERLWRSMKYDCVYLNVFETGMEARDGNREVDVVLQRLLAPLVAVWSHAGKSVDWSWVGDRGSMNITGRKPLNNCRLPVKTMGVTSSEPQPSKSGEILPMPNTVIDID
jgi:hypothetical protein